MIISRNKCSWENEKPKILGLALIDTLTDKIENKFPQSVIRKLLFASKLKIKIPAIEPSNPEPKSPGDYGTKTRKSPFLKSPSPFGKSKFNSPKALDIYTTEMDLSEEYTRVIAHGPIQKMIHIYDDCVLESRNGVVGLSDFKMQLSLPNLKGMVCINEPHQLFCIPDFKNSKSCHLVNPNLEELPLCMAVIEPQYSMSVNVEVFLGLEDNVLLVE